MTIPPINVTSPTVAQGGQIGGIGAVTTGAFFSGERSPAPEYASHNPAALLGGVNANGGAAMALAGLAAMVLFLMVRKK